MMRFLLIRRLSHLCGWKSSSFTVDHSLKLSRADWRSSVSAANIILQYLNSLQLLACHLHKARTAQGPKLSPVAPWI